MVVTLKDIATKLSVSEATVSRALNDRPDVSQEMKQKVVQLAEELNYTPHELARSFRLKRTKLLGLIIRDITNPFFSHLTRSIERIASRKGYNVILCDTGQDFSKEESYIRVLVGRKVDGLILAPFERGVQFDHIIALQREQISFVLIGRILSVETDFVVTDDVTAACEATVHLIRLGHRKIAHFTGPDHELAAERRKQGYRKALLEHGISFDENFVIPGGTALKDGSQAAEQLLALEEKPTAIFAFNDLLALGAMRIIREAGLRIPEDMAIVGFDNIEPAAYANPSLTTIAQPIHQLGEEAVKILIQRIEHRQENSQERLKQVILPCKLTVRESCGTRNV